jgi:hypothetical protein
MDTGVIVAIVIGVLIVLALLWLLGRRGRERRLETRRDEAHQIRREAEVGRAQADRTHAEADERAARARREEANAREQAAQAEAQQMEARERHMEAAKLDPDVDEKEASQQFDREQEERRNVGGITSHGHGELDDDSVEHHEHTRTPDEERERHLVRDEEGNVVQGPACWRAPTWHSALAADGPVPAAVTAQEQPRSPGLLPARRGDRVARPADHAPGAERELVHASIGTPAADGARVVLGFAPGDAAQVRLAPAGHLAAHLQLEGVRPAPRVVTQPASPAPLHAVDRPAQLALCRRPLGVVGRAGISTRVCEQVAPHVEPVPLQAAAPVLVGDAEAPRRRLGRRRGWSRRCRLLSAGEVNARRRADDPREHADADGQQSYASHAPHAPHTGHWPGPLRASSAAARRSCSASGAAAGSPLPPTDCQVLTENWYLPR